MGKRVRVQLFGLQNRGVQIDADATEGARVGKNLLWPDGTVVTEDDIRNSGSSSSTTTSTTSSTVTPTLWSLILSIPARIKSLAGLTTDGWLRADGDDVTSSEHLWTKPSVDTGEDVTIPAGRQMLVHGEFGLDGGTVTVDGELVILDDAEDIFLPRLVLESDSAAGGIAIGDKTADAYGWRDILGQIRQRGTGANDPTWAAIPTTIMSAWKFALSDEVWVEYHIPHDYVPGTDIHFHAHWLSDGTDVTNTVKWEWSFMYADGFGQQAFVPGTPTTVTAEQVSAGQYYHMVTETAAVTISGLEVDGMIYLRLRRIANGATDVTDGIYLMTSDVHYQSHNLATKNKAPNFYT